MLDDTWAVKPATDLAAAIRNKDIKSRELLELYLDRIERLNPALNAVVTLAVEPALAAADARRRPHRRRAPRCRRCTACR